MGETIYWITFINAIIGGLFLGLFLRDFYYVESDGFSDLTGKAVGASDSGIDDSNLLTNIYFIACIVATVANLLMMVHSGFFGLLASGLGYLGSTFLILNTKIGVLLLVVGAGVARLAP